MNCEAARDMVDPYVDGELDAAQSARMQEHIQECAACAAEHAGLLALRADIRARFPYHRAPAGLEDRVRAALRRADHPAPPSWRWIAAAAALLLAVSLPWYIGRQSTRPAQVADAIIDGHVRSLMAGHLTDVPSSDQHTVKPWFNGKLDFSPEVRDLAPQGFPLLGGRLDYVAGHPAAALVYARRQHRINLFIWHAPAQPGGEWMRNGYHVIAWSSGGLAYWAVSDLSAAELRQFVSLLQR